MARTKRKKDLYPEEPAKQTAREIPAARLLLIFGIIAAIYLLLRVNLVGIPLDRDEGAFGYLGRVILDGGLPYRDVVDHKPPVIFYLYALALLFFPPGETGIHLFLHLFNFLTLLSLLFLAKAQFNSWTPALWCAFSYALFSASPGVQGFTASTEMLMLLPITLSLLFAVIAAKRGSRALVCLSGIAGAVAFWTKQTAASSVLFALVWILVKAPGGIRRGKKSAAGAIGWVLPWILGAAAVSLLIAGYFYQKGIFREFVYWSFTHNFSYALQTPLQQSLETLAIVVARLLKGDFLMLGAGVAVALWKLRRSAQSFFILGFLALSLLGVLPGYAYPHYFAQLAPAVALATGWGLSELLAVVKGARRPVAIALCGAILIAVPVTANRWFFLETSPARISRAYFGRNPFPESKQVAAFLAAGSRPQDRVFIFGSEPQLFFYSQRRSATSFVMIYPLTASYPRYREFQETVWRQVQQSRPKYVLLVNIPTSILWDGKADLEIFRRIDQLITRDYTVEAVMAVGGEEGKLFVVDTGKAPSEEIVRNRNNIYIYRAKGS
ncbi:MAG: glycosyltransferase family 39 protein [Acidobacteria bacterium]|nr:glycosyltransferase family 39 protein [Acidobacteriota bacterium]